MCTFQKLKSDINLLIKVNQSSNFKRYIVEVLKKKIRGRGKLEVEGDKDRG